MYREEIVYGILASGHNLSRMAVAPLFALLSDDVATYGIAISPLCAIVAATEESSN